MRRIFTLALLLMVGACSTSSGGDAGRESGRAPTDARPRSTASMRRAIWIDAWNRGMHSPSECEATLAACVEAGFDTLMVEVRKVGDAYYTSDIEPRGEAPAGAAPGRFDPLDWFVEHAGRRAGLRVEAWIVVQRLWKGEAEPPSGWPRHPLRAHPEWALVNGDGERVSAEGQVFADPSDPAARAHVAAVAADIVRRYDVDAIHLDYIRYPSGTWGLGGPGAERFATEIGRRPESLEDGRFLSWRAEQITRTVREIRDAVRARSSRAEVTAAVVCWGEPDTDFAKTRTWREVAQDWPGWLREGLVDRIYPMLYKRERVSTERASYRRWLDLFRRETKHDRIVVGIGGYMNAPADIRAQHAAIREAGLGGVALFSAHHPSRSGRTLPQVF